MVKNKKSLAGSKTIKNLPSDVEETVWAVLTREPGTFIIGKPPMHEFLGGNKAVKLDNPVLMRRTGTKIAFELLDIFDGPCVINTEGTLAIGTLGEPYLTHYNKFLLLPPVAEIEPAPAEQKMIQKTTKIGV